MGNKVEIKTSVEIDVDADSAVDPVEIFRTSPGEFPYGRAPNVPIASHPNTKLKNTTHAKMRVKVSDGSAREILVCASDVLGDRFAEFELALEALRLAAAQKAAGL